MSTDTEVRKHDAGVDTSGTQHNYGNGARASPTPRASRAGVAITKMASEHGGKFTIGRVPFLALHSDR